MVPPEESVERSSDEGSRHFAYWLSIECDWYVFWHDVDIDWELVLGVFTIEGGF
jgi:hypothetical protein